MQLPPAATHSLGRMAAPVPLDEHVPADADAQSASLEQAIDVLPEQSAQGQSSPGNPPAQARPALSETGDVVSVWANRTPEPEMLLPGFGMQSRL